MNVGEIVKWNHSRVDSDDPGWSGRGPVRILRYDPSRAFFAPPVGSGNPGPAVEVEIADERVAPLRVWISPAELEPLSLTHTLALVA